MMRFLLLTSLFLCFSYTQSFAQEEEDIFNYENSKRYAEYLVSTRQWDLAGSEYRRLTFFYPDEQVLKEKLVGVYLLNRNYDQVVEQVSDWEANNSELTESLLLNYGRVLLLNNNSEKYKGFINSRKLSAEGYRYLEIERNLLQLNFKTSTKLVDEFGLHERYGPLLEMEETMKWRSPFLAGTFSMIVPGSGKVYAGAWKDGIVSFIMVGVLSWQAYKGFSTRGVNSTYGWIYGSLGFGMHVGNIYGSVKAAKKFNKNQKQRLVEKIEDYIVYYQ